MRTSSFRHVWTAPLALAALILFGLLAALLGTGIWHVLAWIALMVPVGMAVYFGMRSRHC